LYLQRQSNHFVVIQGSKYILELTCVRLQHGVTLNKQQNVHQHQTNDGALNENELYENTKKYINSVTESHQS